MFTEVVTKTNGIDSSAPRDVLLQFDQCVSSIHCEIFDLIVCHLANVIHRCT